MRNENQPCWQDYALKGCGEAIRVCQTLPERCVEYQRRSMDVDGRPDTCPLQRFEHDLDRTRVGARCRSLIIGDLLSPKVQGLTNTPPLRVVRAWLAHQALEDGAWSIHGDEQMLVIGGTKGIGKTVALAYALSRFDNGMPGGKYVSAIDVVNPKVSIRRLAQVEFLAIDQLGFDYATNESWRHARFTDLLDRRYADMLPTLMAGNISRDAFAKTYGSLVVDRLEEDGAFVEIKAPSLRRARP